MTLRADIIRYFEARKSFDINELKLFEGRVTLNLYK